LEGLCVLTAEQLEEFDRKGFLRLGKVATQEEVAAVRQRMDDIMHGRVPVEGIYFQMDTESGAYEDVPSGGAFQGPSDNYRKIQELERDPVILRYVQHPFFRELCEQLIGPEVTTYRTMFMNKPAGRGTVLPYHQDAGSQWSLSKDPEVTVWTALDPTSKANGCVQVIPGSHKLGLLSERGHTITREQEAMYCPEEKSEYLEGEVGEVFLLHNLLLHRSGVNPTGQSRRALSVCYMDAATFDVKNPSRKFPKIFGSDALRPEDLEASRQG